MPAEAPYSITAKDSRNNLLTVRGDNYPDFQANLTAVLGADGAAKVITDFAQAFGGVPTVQAAVNNVTAAIPQAQPVTSVVGGVPAAPLPQPGAAPAPSGDVPPGVTNPGPCSHGERTFKNTQTKNGMWARWECAMPYSNDTKAFRCKAVNV